MTTFEARPRRAEKALVLIGIVLVALDLRTAVASVSPIVPRIAAEIPLDALTLSVLGAAPPLAFAVSGLLGPAVARAFGLERALLSAAFLMVLGHLARTLAPHGTVLAAATMTTLLAVGVANVLLPPLVKRYFPERIGVVSAVYITLIAFSAAIPALIAVPVADAAGWRVSLAVWAAFALIACLPWLVQLLHMAGRARAEEASGAPALPLSGSEDGLVVLPARSPTAWSMAALFAATSVSVWAAFAWFPTLLVDIAGVQPRDAGALLGVYGLCGIPTALLVPVLASRLRSATGLVAASALLCLLGYLGLLIAPAAAPALWIVLLGLGALAFPLTLVLINLRTRTARGTVAVSGFVQGVGYTVGAAGPVVVGLLHDATGGWTVPLIFHLLALALFLPELLLRPGRRRVEDDPGTVAKAIAAPA